MANQVRLVRGSVLSEDSKAIALERFAWIRENNRALTDSEWFACYLFGITKSGKFDKRQVPIKNTKMTGLTGVATI